MCAKTGFSAVFNSPCDGFIPLLTFCIDKACHLRETLRYLDSSSISICQKADLKSIFEKILQPANFALTSLK